MNAILERELQKMLQEQGDQSESRDSEGSVSRSWVILVLILRRPGLSNLHPYCTDTAHESKRRAQPDQATPTPDCGLQGGRRLKSWSMGSGLSAHPPRPGWDSALGSGLTCPTGNTQCPWLLCFLIYLATPPHVESTGLGVGAPLSTCSTHLGPRL